jgi:hypothetical protein
LQRCVTSSETQATGQRRPAIWPLVHWPVLCMRARNSLKASAAGSRRGCRAATSSLVSTGESGMRAMIAQAQPRVFTKVSQKRCHGGVAKPS